MPTVPSSGAPPSLPAGQHHTRDPGLKRGPAAAAGASRPVEPAGGTVVGGLGRLRKSSVEEAMLSRFEAGASPVQGRTTIRISNRVRIVVNGGCIPQAVAGRLCVGLHTCCCWLAYDWLAYC
jgi:hypothetical protein